MSPPRLILSKNSKTDKILMRFFRLWNDAFPGNLRLNAWFQLRFRRKTFQPLPPSFLPPPRLPIPLGLIVLKSEGRLGESKVTLKK